MIGDKTLDEWIQERPLLEKMITGDEVFWSNPFYQPFDIAVEKISLDEIHIKDAEERLKRFAPYISKVFPDTQKTEGIIESPLRKMPGMAQRLSEEFGGNITGSVLLKCDSHLAISGSIKARGGIYEVLKHAESLALQHKRLTTDDDYTLLDNDKFREFFSHYSIAVGSTGNLGLSIGIMGAQLGFQVFVHMSSDAKQWKKELLRQKGVIVVEYQADYSKAVAEGRNQADLDPNMHFIDDENSTDLFLGYAVAASRLNRQLKELNITVDEEHPLFVYLPCGVGGGPGGITFGLKQLFKDNVHCFFAEPVSSPCMLLGLMTQLHDRINVRDFGLNNKTDADGLAVASPSGFVGKALGEMISGVFTVQDTTLYKLLCMASDMEKISLEPSALAGMPGPFTLFHTADGKCYLEKHGLLEKMPGGTHIVWATGGSMVPPDIMKAYYKKGTEVR
ncbi:MAG: D-serine ammonia-lyase [Desulfobacterium sp.]|nr:D-serine ammonia-lyase [Desulfobacterium sp.]